ncbi:MAG: hypothetical protein ABW202_23265 [Duganella sp.]
MSDKRFADYLALAMRFEHGELFVSSPLPDFDEDADLVSNFACLS